MSGVRCQVSGVTGVTGVRCHRGPRGNRMCQRLTCMPSDASAMESALLMPCAEEERTTTRGGDSYTPLEREYFVSMRGRRSEVR